MSRNRIKRKVVQEKTEERRKKNNPVRGMSFSTMLIGGGPLPRATPSHHHLFIYIFKTPNGVSLGKRSRNLRLLEFQHGTPIPVFEAMFPQPTFSGVPARDSDSHVQGTVPEPHCQWSSGIPVFKARFPNLIVIEVLASPCSRHGSRTLLLLGFWHSPVQGAVPEPYCY